MPSSDTDAGPGPSSYLSTVREWVWPTDGRDPVGRLLVIGIAIVGLVLVGIVAYGVYAVSRDTKAPRTEAEKQLMTLDGLINAQPENPKVWADYAAVLIRTEQYALAEDAISRGLKATKNDPSIMLQRARLYRARGQQTEALTQVSKTIEAARKFREAENDQLLKKGILPQKQANEVVVEAEVLRAEIYETLLRWKDADKSYTVALNENPVMADILTSRAKVRIELKQIDKAKADIEAALKLAPDYAPAKETLEQIKKESGK